MKNPLKPIKTILIGGAVFLIPAAIVAVAIGKVFQVIAKMAVPLSKLLPFESVAGIAIVNVVAFVLLVVICFFAGLIAKSTLGGKFSKSVESKLYDFVPRYAFIKSTAAAFSGQSDDFKILKPIMVNFDDYSQIAFEIHSGPGDMTTIYLPGAPDPWSGSVLHVANSRVEHLDVDFNTVIQSLKKVGIGSEKIAASSENK